MVVWGMTCVSRWAYSLSLATSTPLSALTSNQIVRHPQRETDTLAPILLFPIGLLDAGFITAGPNCSI